MLHYRSALLCIAAAVLTRPPRLIQQHHHQLKESCCVGCAIKNCSSSICTVVRSCLMVFSGGWRTDILLSFPDHLLLQSPPRREWGPFKPPTTFQTLVRHIAHPRRLQILPCLGELAVRLYEVTAACQFHDEVLGICSADTDHLHGHNPLKVACCLGCVMKNCSSSLCTAVRGCMLVLSGG